MDRKLEHTSIEKLKSAYTLETGKNPETDVKDFREWATLKTSIAAHNFLIDLINLKAGEDSTYGGLKGNL